MVIFLAMHLSVLLSVRQTLGRSCAGLLMSPHKVTVTNDASCLSLKGAADEWRATRDWVDQSGAVDIEALEREFGGALVWVTDTARHALSYANLIFYLTRPTPCPQTIRLQGG